MLIYFTFKNARKTKIVVLHLVDALIKICIAFRLYILSVQEFGNQTHDFGVGMRFFNQYKLLSSFNNANMMVRLLKAVDESFARVKCLECLPSLLIDTRLMTQ